MVRIVSCPDVQTRAVVAMARRYGLRVRLHSWPPTEHARSNESPEDLPNAARDADRNHAQPEPARPETASLGPGQHDQDEGHARAASDHAAELDRPTDPAFGA